MWDLEHYRGTHESIQEDKIFPQGNAQYILMEWNGITEFLQEYLLLKQPYLAIGEQYMFSIDSNLFSGVLKEKRSR